MKVKFFMFIAFILVLFTSIALYYENRQLRSDNRSQQSQYDTLAWLKNKQDEEFAQVLQVKELEKAEYLSKIDSVSKLLSVKSKFIKGSDSYVSKTEFDTVVLTKTVYVPEWKDSAYSFKYDDSWTTITGEVGKKFAKVKYNAVDTLIRVRYSRTNIFGKTENLVYLRNSNPNVKFTKGYVYEEKEKRAWLTIGPAVYVDPFNGRIGLGISAQYPLIQLKR